MIRILKANFWLLLALAVGFNFGMFVTLRMRPNPEQLWAFFGSVSGTIVALLGALAFYQFQRRDRAIGDFDALREQFRLLRLSVDTALEKITADTSRDDAATFVFLVLRRARSVDKFTDRLDPSSIVAHRLAMTLDWVSPETIEDLLKYDGADWREYWRENLERIVENLERVDAGIPRHGADRAGATIKKRT